jgi:hypothetical protein
MLNSTRANQSRPPELPDLDEEEEKELSDCWPDPHFSEEAKKRVTFEILFYTNFCCGSAPLVASALMSLKMLASNGD